MSLMQIQLAILISLFLLKIVSGIILTINYSPYNGWLSTLHKLSALAAGILFFIVCFYARDKITGFFPQGLLTIIFYISFVLAFASGAWILAASPPRFIIFLHRISSPLSLVLAFVSLLFLFFNKI